jgi:hypothetical protein
MVHKESRLRLAEALRHYVSGQITNDDLDDVEVDWRDSGAIAVKERSWLLYDDLIQHRATGEFRLAQETREEISRWILFLHSDCDYTWPAYRFDQIVNWPMKILTLGWWERQQEKRWNEFKAAGEFAVWPFLRREEFENALAYPRLLAGRPSP